jgi:1,4-alpha-glucan branching enzyme
MITGDHGRPAIETAHYEALARGEHDHPHGLLGLHSHDGAWWLRAWHPDATAVDAICSDGEVSLAPTAPGLFSAKWPHEPGPYRLRFRFADGASHERDDPYRFPPSLGATDLHLLLEGTHRNLWQALGARAMTVDEVEGVAFAVWAPNARRVSVVGDFCTWDGRVLPMRNLQGSGVFELFVPGVAPGALYKYEIRTREGALRLKADPVATWMEAPPATASRVWRSSYQWNDAAWMTERARRDPAREAMSVYEVHLGSWARVVEEGNRSLTYREIAPRLARHVNALGFTHVELMPVAEHAFYGSWGYQVTGYYAPTTRYGTPDDFRFLVDTLHQHGIGVLLDWVPAHFPRDDFALRRFDGTALYEHEDPRLGEHPDWGTLIFNFARSEVRNFLVANALYWLREFHLDGLRVDAVASMLYLDYSREADQWLPNREGGRENLDAIEFLREFNHAVHEEVPGAVTVAEESTAWPGVTRPISEGGLGFDFKWNMGWMNDTLAYFAREPMHRSWHQDQLSFAMVYEYNERFLAPLSHDEVVHGKGSLYTRMPGDPWQRLANLRLLLTYQYTRPGKQLLFMGTEIAQQREWNHDCSIDWHLGDEPDRAAFTRFVAALGALYRATPALWRCDHDARGFQWLDCSDRSQSVFSYLRHGEEGETAVIVLNCTPVPRIDYRIGIPLAGRWLLHFDSDDQAFNGSQVETPRDYESEPLAQHGHPQSVRLTLPPLAALVLVPDRSS